MVTRIARDEVRALMDGGALLVETLPNEEYAEEHIAGAIHISLRDMDNARLATLDRSKPIIVYCQDTL